MSYAENLKQIRKENNLSQEERAKGENDRSITSGLFTTLNYVNKYN